jgi:hypothetical protein
LLSPLQNQIKVTAALKIKVVLLVETSIWYDLKYMTKGPENKQRLRQSSDIFLVTSVYIGVKHFVAIRAAVTLILRAAVTLI